MKIQSWLNFNHTWLSEFAEPRAATHGAACSGVEHAALLTSQVLQSWRFNLVHVSCTAHCPRGCCCLLCGSIVQLPAMLQHSNVPA